MTKAMYTRWIRPVGFVLILTALALGGAMPTPTAWAGTGTVKSDNPLSGDPAAIAAGKAAFRGGFCGLCHGMFANGHGHGLPNSANLQKFKRGYSAFVKTVKEGYRTMPAWGGGKALDDQTINEIGAWLETLAKPEANWKDPVDN